MNEFEGKVALVTGAGRGLGRILARAFAERGATVAANDITPVNLDTTIEKIRSAGGQAQAYESDIAKKIQVQTMVRQVLEDLGKIDLLVNNAGVHPKASLLEIDEWDWRRTIDVNLTGTFLCTQIVGRAMRETGGGAIVNVAASMELAYSSETSAVFAASKSALVGFTRSAARELASSHIRVNAVGPVSMLEIDPASLDSYASKVAEAVLKLCSPQNALTGQFLEILSS